MLPVKNEEIPLLGEKRNSPKLQYGMKMLVFMGAVTIVGILILVLPRHSVSRSFPFRVGSKTSESRPPSRKHQTLSDVERRMEYWDKNPVKPPNTASRDKGTKYLIFHPDRAGLNNIRIGWEIAVLIAAATSRTMVLPPPESWYRLDEGPDMVSRIEEFINLAQLRKMLPVSTFEEFVETERRELDKLNFNQSVPLAASPTQLQPLTSEASWTECTKRQCKEKARQWYEFALSNFHVLSNKEDKSHDATNICDLGIYQKAGRFAFVHDADNHQRLFLCSQWSWFGGTPNLIKENQPWVMPGWGYKLLKDGLVWHRRFVRVAAPVVQKLGMFQYYALHDRSPRDFDFAKDTLQQNDSVAEHVSQFSAVIQQSLHAMRRGESLASRVEVQIPSGSVLYIATDITNPRFLEAFQRRKINAVTWSTLLQASDGPLAAAKAQYDKSQLDKISGPVEQLICANAKVFIGHDKSTFSGYIDRMRLYNGAPTSGHKLVHQGMPSMSEQEAVKKQISDWKAEDSLSNFHPEHISGMIPSITDF